MSQAVISSNKSLMVEPIYVSRIFSSAVTAGDYRLVYESNSNSYADFSVIIINTGSSIRVTVGTNVTDYIYQNIFSSPATLSTFNTSNKLIVPCGASVWIDFATIGSSIAMSGSRFINSP